MTNNLYPTLKNARSVLEVVDDNNRPLCLMAAQDVVRQSLRHRAVALLIRDRTGRALLTYWAGRGWGASSFGLVSAGLSCEQCAQELLRQDWQHEGRMLPLGFSPPCPESNNAFVALFEARLPTWLVIAAAQDADRHMLVDHDELRGLGIHFDDLLSPYLRMAVQAGHVWPR